ncbi:MAG TPA: zinc dependent phospholipase C family protein [Bacteroidia bacterium]|nr:zinc dependent phospholipase C family protein [Bacteroidia bacterium]
MKPRSVAAFILLLSLTLFFASWGVFGHEKINHTAVLALPEGIQLFFYNHIDFITQESTVPDLRKYTLNDEHERPRHFIHLESYGGIKEVPQNLVDLNKKYDQEFVSHHGILPWHICRLTDMLTRAFREKRKTEILFLAADLGHYVADAHMPLHTSLNHDGELTGQRGIHSFWEAQLPDLFGKEYTFKVREAKYMNAIEKEVWTMIYSSHQLVDTLLIADKNLKKNFPEGNIYLKESNGNIAKNKFNKPIHSAAYSKMYHDALNHMVENQMQKAISFTADLWLTAWINAGKPDLTDLDPSDLSRRNAVLLGEELQLLKSGKLLELKSEREF